MAARPPVASTNRQAASTLGPIDPAANRQARRLGWRRERRIVRVDHHLGQQGGHLAVGQLVLQGLLEQVADHAFTLRAQHVQGIRPNLGVGLALQDEQADLGAVALVSTSWWSAASSATARAATVTWRR
jgi:hypothetical protein